MEKAIILQVGKLQAIDMPEKPKSCKERNIPCCGGTECIDQCDLYDHDLPSYLKAVKKAKAEAIDFRPEDYRINKLKIEFFNPATVYHTLEQIKEGEIYPRPDGFEIEVVDYYEGTVNHKRQYSKCARLVPIKEQKQTINPNKPGYLMSSNLPTDSMPKHWIDLWQQIEIWYGDPLKRETAEQLLNRIIPKFIQSENL